MSRPAPNTPPAFAPPPTAPPFDIGGMSSSPLLKVVLLIACPFIAYWPALDGDFHLDDHQFLSMTKPGDFSRQLFRDPRVVVHLTMAANRWISGEHPGGYLMVNVLIHLVNGLLLFRLLQLIPGLARLQGSSVAFFAALLWAVHPLNTQAVAYISQRCESLMATFYLATMIFHTHGVVSGKRKWFGAAFAAFCLGAFCKQPIWLAPIVLIFWDWLILRQDVSRFRKLWPAYAAYLAPAVIPAVLFIPQVISNDATIGANSHTGHLSYLLTQSEIIAHYLRLVVYPDTLCFDYQWPLATTFSDVIPQGLVTVAVVLATIVATYFRRRVAFAGIWLLMILAPTSSLLPISDAAVEHRMYLPSAGVLVLIVLLLNDVARRCQMPRVAFPLLLSFVAVLLGARTFQRTQDYQSDERLWQSVIATAPMNGRAYVNLIHLYQQDQQPLKALQVAQKFHQNTGGVSREGVLKALGPTLCDRRIVDGAIASLRAMRPQAVTAVDVAEHLANAADQVGRWDLAAGHYAVVVAKRPNDVPLRSSLAYALAQSQQFRDAQRQLEVAIQLQPDDAELRYNLGAMAAAQGDRETAITQFRAALERNPGYAPAALGLKRLEGEAAGTTERPASQSR